MSKFKIIEGGRILSPEELKEIQGGAPPIVGCGSGQGYTSCGVLGYVSCGQTQATYGYTLSDCNGGPWYSTCVTGYSYNSCGIAGSKTTCPGTQNYASAGGGGTHIGDGSVLFPKPFQ